jgi:3-oxoacyl-[acyl-carrier protein] reductase
MIEDKALEGKVAIVTGGSRGIGRACAVALGSRGAKVIINYHSREDAAREAASAVEASGGSAAIEAFDTGDPAAVDAAIKRIGDREGRIDILVNNAGIAIDGLLLRVKQEDWDKTLAVNLTGLFATCKAASRYLLKARETGRIINITSVVGEMGNAGQVAYASAKAGIIGLTKSLARELAARGITANAVSPGFIETDMTAAHVTGDARTQLVSRIPAGRMGRAEEVADVVAFLAGPEAGYITGEVIRVNGGLLM